MKTLLKLFPQININHQNENGLTPFLAAIANKYYDCAKYLLECPKINIELADCCGYTPFLQASRYGCLDILRLLYEHDANPLSTTINGHNALHLASCNMHIPVIQFLRSLDVAQDLNNERQRR